MLSAQIFHTKSLPVGYNPSLFYQAFNVKNIQKVLSFIDINVTVIGKCGKVELIGDNKLSKMVFLLKRETERPAVVSMPLVLCCTDGIRY